MKKKIALFKSLVDICHNHQIRLEVFFCPTRAIYWEAIYKRGLWSQFEDLKRQLSAFHTIWNFSGFNCITTETFVKPDYPLYFECSHFTPYTGSLILKRIFAPEIRLSSFGINLDPHTIEQGLKTIRFDRLKWAEKNVDIVDKVQNALLSIQ